MEMTELVYRPDSEWLPSHKANKSLFNLAVNATPWLKIFVNNADGDIMSALEKS